MTTKGKKAWILTADMGNNHTSLNTFCRKLSEELLTDIFTKVFIDSSTGKTIDLYFIGNSFLCFFLLYLFLFFSFSDELP